MNHIVSKKDMLSPFFNFKFLIHTDFYDSVWHYMDTRKDMLNDVDALRWAYLHRIGQDIPLQNTLKNPNLRLTFQYIPDIPWTQYISDTFGYILYQFGDLPVEDIQRYIPCIYGNTMNRLFDQEERVDFYRRSFPFIGKDNAMELTRCWLHYKVLGIQVPPETEQLFKTYEK